MKAIAVIDLSNTTLSIYDIPDDLILTKDIEQWLNDNTNHHLSNCSWGEYN